MFVFGLNWWAFGFSAFIILTGVRLVLKGSDTFLSTRPAQRIDERQRYLRSRSLYCQKIGVHADVVSACA